MSLKLESSVESVIKASDIATRAGRLVTASNIAATAKSLCPEDTGESKNSISFGEIDENAAHASVGTGYFIYVEFGTKKQAAQPTMRPAKDLSEGKSIEDVKKIMVEQVDDAASIRKVLFG